MMRIRIKFAKTEEMRYIGHLDLFRAWERTFRRSGLPLAYSLGFHPGPRLNLACALPVGFTSDCEIIDAWLECTLPLPDVQTDVLTALPPGISILGIEEITTTEPALQTQVISASYIITFLDGIPDLDARVQRVLSSEQLLRQRRGKTYDLRPLIEEIQILPPDEQGNLNLRVQLAAREGATGRPEELLIELGVNFENTRVHRDKLILCTD